MKNKIWILIVFISIVAIIFIKPKLSEKQVISSQCSGDNDIWVRDVCYEYSSNSKYPDICRIDGQRTLWETYCANDKCVQDVIDCSIYNAICIGGKCVKE